MSHLSIKLLLIVCLTIISTSGHACEFELSLSAPQNTLNLEQASTELTSLLLSTHDAEPIKSNDIVSSIECYLRSQQSQLDSLQEIIPPLSQIGRNLNSSDTIEEQRQAIALINQFINRDAGTAYISLPGGSNNAVEVSLYDDLIYKNCGAQATQQCAQTTALAKSLWWIVGEYRSFANNYNQDDKASSLAFNSSLEQQWQSYKDDTIKLWPQEVLLNSIVYRPAQAGLSRPPSYKLLALRPSLGLSYLSDQSHRVQPTINVDLLGIYWWKYKGAKAGKGRGISASLVWDGDDSALGISYHHNPKWSATIAHGDENDLVLSISFQFAQWFIKK